MTISGNYSVYVGRPSLKTRLVNLFTSDILFLMLQMQVLSSVGIGSAIELHLVIDSGLKDFY